MFVPGFLVQLLHWLAARFFCEEFGVQLVFSFIVRLHLAERYQVAGRWKFTLFILSVQWSAVQAMKFFKYLKSTQNIFSIKVLIDEVQQ